MLVIYRVYHLQFDLELVGQERERTQILLKVQYRNVFHHKHAGVGQLGELFQVAPPGRRVRRVMARLRVHYQVLDVAQVQRYSIFYVVTQAGVLSDFLEVEFWILTHQSLLLSQVGLALYEIFVGLCWI